MHTETTHSEQSDSQIQKKDGFLEISILVSALMISGSILYAGGGGSPSVGVLPNEPVKEDPEVSLGELLDISDRDTILGDKNAPVTIIEYADYKCGFCRKFFTEVSPSIRDEYVQEGKVNVVYRNLAFLGPESVEAAEAAECAKDQGKFWSFHDELYGAIGTLNREVFVSIATELGLDVSKFSNCYDKNQYADYVKAETAAAQAAGIDSTPTVFINDSKIKGALPYANFKAEIENQLKLAK